MAVGQVVKLHGGFYYVREETTGTVRRCVRRGRLSKVRLLVGDYVETTEAASGSCVIEKVLPRRTELIRPPVANIEQALIVFALRDPRPDFQLLDRFLVLSSAAGVEPIICLNKTDLTPVTIVRSYMEAYRAAGYRLILTSARTGEGLDDLRAVLRGRFTVLAGPSGVGKSSLLNAIQPGFRLKTGEVSAKTRRGRHVTRLVELLPIEGGGFVCDTPGFTELKLPEIPPEAVARYFPEIGRWSENCRFHDCLHVGEPDCAVRKAVKEKKLPLFRYRHYTAFVAEIVERERRKYL